MTRSLRAYLAAALFAALVAGAVQPAHAFVRETSNWNPRALPVQYYINTSTIPSGITADIVNAGYQSWAAPACTAWRVNYAGNTTSGASTSDRRNTTLFVSGSWPAELGDVRVTIGVTTPVWTSGGYFIDADMQLNNVGFRWTTTGASGSVDCQSIVTHEAGHFLGLDHSPLSSAVMYASYSGGIKRTLTSDDTSGVCTIYPSGTAIPDAGMMSSDPCAMYSSCAGCTPVNGCGWCGATGQCVSGTQTGPSAGSCGSGWAWLMNECTTTTPPDSGTSGGAAFGEPCTDPSDCASGGLCVGSSATNAFCSRACTDDCTCPRSYRCVPTTQSGLSVCAPGTNTCPTMSGTDSGATGTDSAVPGDDVQTNPGDDVQSNPGDDAGTNQPDARTTSPNPSNCICATPGRPTRGAPWALLALTALAMIVARRRRS